MKSDLFSLEERTVVITGGLGQLGLQFSQSCIDHGANVAILDRDSIVKPTMINDIDPQKIIVLNTDVTSKRELIDAKTKIVDRWGSIDGLINNAAIDSPPNSPPEENGPFEHYPEESWDRILDVNLKGTFLTSQIFGSEMARSGGGSIVNIGSIYGVVSPDQSIYEYRRENGEEFYKPVAYSVSKCGVYNLTRYMATYWGKKNVRVNTLTFAGVFNNQDEKFLNSYCSRIPIGRMAKETEYNGSVVFLLSDASSYMTGSELTIDGGWTAI